MRDGRALCELADRDQRGGPLPGLVHDLGVAARGPDELLAQRADDTRGRRASHGVLCHDVRERTRQYFRVVVRGPAADPSLHDGGLHAAGHVCWVDAWRWRSGKESKRGPRNWRDAMVCALPNEARRRSLPTAHMQTTVRYREFIVKPISN